MACATSADEPDVGQTAPGRKGRRGAVGPRVEGSESKCTHVEQEMVSAGP
jgi:hypothetical protein